MDGAFLRDFLTKYHLQIIWTLLVSFTILLVVRWLTGKKKNHLPPRVRGLPFVGYLPFLRHEPFRKLHHLKQKYGNVFSIYLGKSYVVILGDYTAVKEAFSKSTTTDRPIEVFDFLPDGVGFSSVNGEEWVEQRRYCMRAMRDLGLGRSAWETLVEEEVADFVKLISRQGGRPINVCNLLTSSVSNNIASLIFGKRLPMGDPAREFLNESLDTIMQFFSLVGVHNFFPSVVRLCVKLGITKFARIHKKMVEFNNYVRQEVEQRKKVANTDNSDIFIDDYLKEMENNEVNKLGNTFNDVNLRGNVQALFLAGSDTTRTSINWLLLAMANFSDVQDKVQEELDAILGKEGKITWPERSKVPYTFATIMEAQRWQTIAPLNTPRIAMEDIKVCGYDIPKGSTIIANNWGLHNDPKYWNNPEKFDPEHFLTDGGKQIINKTESYVPFSYGRRNCPGETVAMIEILYYFTALLQKFRVLPPEGEKPKLDAILGLTYQAVDQTLRFVPRNGRGLK